MRLIDADLLIQTLNERDISYNADIDDVIRKAPTVEPKKGKWIHEGLEAGYVRCSSCGFRDYTEYYSNYCPHCGAEMEMDK